MASSQETFSKKEREKKRLKKKKDKEEKKEERQANAKKGQSLEEMIAYVDENGNITKDFMLKDINDSSLAKEEKALIKTFTEIVNQLYIFRLTIQVYIIYISI